MAKRFEINGNMVNVELYDGSTFSYRSDYVRDGKITSELDFGEELREKIYGQ